MVSTQISRSVSAGAARRSAHSAAPFPWSLRPAGRRTLTPSIPGFGWDIWWGSIGDQVRGCNGIYIYISIYLSVRLSFFLIWSHLIYSNLIIYLSMIYLWSIYVSIYLSVCLSVYLSIYLSLRLSVCLSIYIQYIYISNQCDMILGCVWKCFCYLQLVATLSEKWDLKLDLGGS